VFQPQSLREPAALSVVEAPGPDLLVVVAYGELLNRRALHAAPHGALNVHPSLLPRYRGASPIPAAILNGDDVTGVTVMQLVRRLDAGPVLAQQAVDIRPEETAGDLSERLAHTAAALLPQVCLDWVAEKLLPTPQDDAQATYTREWSRADARIDWQSAADEIVRLVRAANPWPVAWTQLAGNDVRIWSAGVVADARELQAGGVGSYGARVFAGSGAGAVELRRVQPAGKPVMDALSWWNGLRTQQVRFT
jgi:methionyl-tRNA formyltransferase